MEKPNATEEVIDQVLDVVNQVLESRKYEVLIYGEVPECIEVEADTKQQAINRAVEDLLDRLTFCVGRPGTGEVVCRKVGA